MPWSSTDKSTAITLSGSDYIANRTSGTTTSSVRGTISRNSGKWYVEYHVLTAAAGFAVGFANASHALSSNITATTNAFGVRENDAALRRNSSNLVATVSPSGALHWFCLVRFAIDITAGLVWATVDNGLWNNSGSADPAAGTGGVSYSVTGPLFPAFTSASSPNAVLLAEGQYGAYNPPSGFSWWDGGSGPTNLQVASLASTNVLNTGNGMRVWNITGANVLNIGSDLRLWNLTGSVVLDTSTPPPPPSSQIPVVFIVCGG